MRNWIEGSQKPEKAWSLQGSRRVLAEEGRKEPVIQRKQLSCGPREGWKCEGRQH